MIIADDESVIISGLQKLIDWKGLGIEIIGTYEDGKSAFEGLVSGRPELALLDISMPEMTGIEILKECSLMKLPTQIILVSGFQDFEYAREAVTYGAADYLLKPVIREELLNAVGRCTAQIRRERQDERREAQNNASPDYGKLIQVEDTWYTPAAAHIFYPQPEERQMRKLIEFSFASCIEEYMEENGCGISFVRHGDVVIVFKGMDRQACRDVIEDLGSCVKNATAHQAFFVVGREVRHMSEISEAYEECLAEKGYLFFADRLQEPVIETGRSVFAGEVKPERFERVKEELLGAVLKKDAEAFDNYFRQYEKMVCHMSAGKKEDACFYFCSVLRVADERFAEAGFGEHRIDMKELLDTTRNTVSFDQLTGLCRRLLEEYMNRIQELASDSERAGYLHAKDYIDRHYSENLTLNVLAGEVHMNPYYFSTFFKKNMGENFKSYLNRVRLEHAVPLLVSTNKKTYEIAVEVGFTDARTFSEAFQKQYKMTPTEYRKRVRNSQK